MPLIVNTGQTSSSRNLGNQLRLTRYKSHLRTSFANFPSLENTYGLIINAKIIKKAKTKTHRNKQALFFGKKSNY